MIAQHCFVIGALCLAVGAMLWEYRHQPKIKWMAAIPGIISIIMFTYLSLFPVGSEATLVDERESPLVEMSQNVVLEDPITKKRRESASELVRIAYETIGRPPATKGYYVTRDENGKVCWKKIK